jgi:hypothetical protein
MHMQSASRDKSYKRPNYRNQNACAQKNYNHNKYQRARPSRLFEVLLRLQAKLLVLCLRAPPLIVVHPLRIADLCE